YWAYRFLSMLGGTELQNSDESSYACTDDHGGVQMLLWDLTHPTANKMSNQEHFFRPHPASEKGNVAVKLKHLSPGNYGLKIYQVGYRQNDPYSSYLDIGSPSDLNREAVASLKNLSAGKPVSDTNVVVSASGEFDTVLPLRENDVYFISLVHK